MFPHYNGEMYRLEKEDSTHSVDIVRLVSDCGRRERERSITARRKTQRGRDHVARSFIEGGRSDR